MVIPHRIGIGQLRGRDANATSLRATPGRFLSFSGRRLIRLSLVSAVVYAADSQHDRVQLAVSPGAKERSLKFLP
jgi:hypothetical protein